VPIAAGYHPEIARALNSIEFLHSTRAPASVFGNSEGGPNHGGCQSDLGSAAHPSGAAEARPRDFRTDAPDIKSRSRRPRLVAERRHGKASQPRLWSFVLFLWGLLLRCFCIGLLFIRACLQIGLSLLFVGSSFTFWGRLELGAGIWRLLGLR
jgi:hypothetical protein